MTSLSEIKDKVAVAARTQARNYSPEQPLGGYAATVSVYGALVAAVAVGTKLTGRSAPPGLSPADAVKFAAATHKLSRLLTKDPVTSPLRAPFTKFEGQEGAAELHEEVRGQGERKAVGELLTCPFCAEVWVATALTAGRIFLPQLTRTAIDVLAGLAGADILQFTRAWLEKESSAG
jgi:Protein of unknown function (DUF1360)